MFERNRPNSQEQVSVAIEIALDDGCVETGQMVMAASRSVFDVLNGPALFLEFKPYDGERHFIAKSGLKSVKLLAGARPLDLAQKVRDLDGFDPYTILGVKSGDAWEQVRSAYLVRAKSYHPDRFANVELPAEVIAYLAGMLRRVNAAYAALEMAQNSRKTIATQRQEAIYVTGARA